MSVNFGKKCIPLPLSFIITVVIASSLLLCTTLYFPKRVTCHIAANDANCSQRNILLGPAMQDDPCVVDIIRKQYLVPPSTSVYNLTSKPSDDFTLLDAQKKEVIEKYLDTKDKNGFFIECGANDGEWNSFTLQVEFDYKWKGLLIEPTADTFNMLKAKNRKAWLVNACLSPVNYTSQMEFYMNPNANVVNGLHSGAGTIQKTTVQCFPLYAILVALNIKVVDYFLLDIEGVELEVLKTIPFDKVTIKIIQLEHIHIPGGRKAAEEFLKTKDYTFIRNLSGGYTQDFIFVHKSIIARH